MDYKKLKTIEINLKSPDKGFKKNIIGKTFINPNKKIETFFVDKDKDSVQIFPITSKNKVYLVQQFRPNTESVELEFPGGGCETGEDITESALRELKEECGLNTNNIIHLASINYSPYSSGKRHCFLALDCIEEFSLDLDPNEFLQVTVKELEDVKDLASKGKFRGFDTFFMGLEILKNKKLIF